MIPLPFLPIVDGVLLPDHPLAAVATGAAVGIDLLIGTNRDELTLFGLGNPALMALDDEGVERWVDNAVPDMSGAEVIDAYRAARRARDESIEANDVWVAVGTDIVFRWPSLQLAAAHAARGSRAYVYLFDWESPAFGGILGSCHALELPFVFGAVNLPVVQVFSGAGPAVEELSAEMQRAWLAFAATGDPAHEMIGSWRQWDPAARATMIFGADTRLEEAPRNEELAVLERHRPLVSGVPG
jgi:para-nitrobenzyl esterase